MPPEVTTGRVVVVVGGDVVVVVGGEVVVVGVVDAEEAPGSDEVVRSCWRHVVVEVFGVEVPDLSRNDVGGGAGTGVLFGHDEADCDRRPGRRQGGESGQPAQAERARCRVSGESDCGGEVIGAGSRISMALWKGRRCHQA